MVRWKGYDQSEDMWLKETQLEHSAKLLEKFQRPEDLNGIVLMPLIALTVVSSMLTLGDMQSSTGSTSAKHVSNFLVYQTLCWKAKELSTSS